MNELQDLCQVIQADYNNVKKLLLMDSQNVPGFDGRRGFDDGTKEILSLYSQFQEPNIIFQSISDRNTKPISLVIGGAGLIGSQLCEHLLKTMGHTVICLDNLKTETQQYIQEFLDNPDFLFKNADISNKQYLPHIDFIWHLACPPKNQLDGYNTLQTCLLGTMNVLELARVHGCPLLFASANDSVNPVDEGTRCAEALIYEYRKKHVQLADKLKIARIFPKMDISDMISGFKKMIFSCEVGPIHLGNAISI
jgi:hypothetical protein